MILRNIPPGLTTTIQLKTRTVGSDTPGSNVGSPISGTSSGTTYTYSLGAYATGDYWCVLSGVSTPAASAFPVRDDVAYFVPWSIVEATVRATPPTPDPITGMCNLLVSTTGGAGSRVWAKLADTNNTADQILIGQQVVEDTTDEDGNATLVLIQSGQFTAGGNYRIRVADTARNITNNVLVRMPNTSSANLEDLTPL
jgi:hypothetical protein